MGLGQAISVRSAAQLHLSFSIPHSERLVGSFSLSHCDRSTYLPERPSMPLLTLPSHVASPIARAVQIGLPVRAPRSGCCHFVGSTGSSRLQTGTTGRAVVGILGTLLGDSLIWDANCCTFAAPAGAQCDVLATAMVCSSMLLSGRPIPGLPLSSLPGAHFCVEIPRPVATELAPPGGCTGPLAADLNNRT